MCHENQEFMGTKGLDTALGTKVGEAEKGIALGDSCLSARFVFSL